MNSSLSRLRRNFFDLRDDYQSDDYNDERVSALAPCAVVAFCSDKASSAFTIMDLYFLSVSSHFFREQAKLISTSHRVWDPITHHAPFIKNVAWHGRRGCKRNRRGLHSRSTLSPNRESNGTERSSVQIM